MPIGHIGLLVSNLEEAKALYLSALAPLGYETAVTFPGRVGLGAGGVPDFWLRVPGECVITGAQPHKDVHVAFAAARREVVDQVHAAAMAAGAKDNGKPGPREYTPTYYAAFFIDKDGNNIEAFHM